MTSLTPSALHPIGFNPLLAPSSELEPVSRSALLLPSSDDDNNDAFERDVEGEQALLRLLGGTFGLPESTVGGEEEEEGLTAVPEPEVLDFRLFSTRPVQPFRLVPKVVEYSIPNPAHQDLSDEQLSILRLRAQSAAISASSLPSLPTLLSLSAQAGSSTTKHYQTQTPSTKLSTLMCTSRDRPPSTNPRMQGHPPPPPPERGPGGHLPCLQIPLFPSSPSSSTSQTSSSSSSSSSSSLTTKPRSSKRKRSHPCRPPTPRKPAQFFHPDPKLGGKSLGYAYGFNLPSTYLLACNPLAASEGYVRDRMRTGWVDKKKGESWWGSRGDAGGRTAKESAKLRWK